MGKGGAELLQCLGAHHTGKHLNDYISFFLLFKQTLEGPDLLLGNSEKGKMYFLKLEGIY